MFWPKFLQLKEAPKRTRRKSEKQDCRSLEFSKETTPSKLRRSNVTVASSARSSTKPGCDSPSQRLSSGNAWSRKLPASNLSSKVSKQVQQSRTPLFWRRSLRYLSEDALASKEMTQRSTQGRCSRFSILIFTRLSIGVRLRKEIIRFTRLPRGMKWRIPKSWETTLSSSSSRLTSLMKV